MSSATTSVAAVPLDASDATATLPAAAADTASSAPATSARKQLHFPPDSLSVFVIHHRSTDYHVHRWVLHHHSEYFRTYLATLQPLVEAKVEEKGAGKVKRRRVTAVVSSDCEAAQESCGDRCSGHSPLQHCIELPDQCGVAESSEVDMELFLQHLYFSSALHMPPYRPKAEVLSAAVTAAPSLTFPSGAAFLPATESSPAQYVWNHATNTQVWRPAMEAAAVPDAYTAESRAVATGICMPLLSLFHYFDCRQALKRCDEVVASQFTLYSLLTCWHLLTYCSVYGLKAAETKCIDAVAKDTAVKLDDAQYAERLQRVLRVAPQAFPRLVAAMSSYLHPSYPYTRQS